MGKAVNMRYMRYMAECKKLSSADPGLDGHFAEWALETMLAQGWSLPTNQMEALDLYGKFFA